MVRWINRLILIGFLIIAVVNPLPAGTLDLLDAGGSLMREVRFQETSGEILLDLYDFFSSLGYSVRWQSAIDRLEIENGQESFSFRAGSRRVLVGDERLYTLQPPRFSENRLYLSVDSTARFINEKTARDLVWNRSRMQMQLVDAEVEQERGGREQAAPDPVKRYLEEEMQSENDREWLVVIDPGHGGRDPGAIGPTGLMEKDVVLAISKKLSAILENDYGNIRTFLTRDSDRFISLQARTRAANELEADLFVSIHANGHHSPHANGYEVFVLSGEASDPSAEELATTENSVLKQYEGYQQEELDGLVWILHQLRGMVHTRESESLARMMTGVMGKRMSIPGRGVKGAPLWVLKDAQMPAVLVETSFLSNPREEERLRDSEYREKIAGALAEAIFQYRERYYCCADGVIIWRPSVPRSFYWPLHGGFTDCLQLFPRSRNRKRCPKRRLNSITAIDMSRGSRLSGGHYPKPSVVPNGLNR